MQMSNTFPYLCKRMFWMFPQPKLTHSTGKVKEMYTAKHNIFVLYSCNTTIWTNFD